MTVDMKAMKARVARFRDLRSSSEAFVDTRIPEYNREIYNVIGRGVTEDTRLAPAIDDAKDFHLTFMKADPGKGSSLHDHETIECFVPLTGTWAILLGDEGADRIVLERFDTFSVPPGVMRAVQNAGTGPSVILTILGGTDPGRVRWSAQINEKAKALGLVVNANGELVRLTQK